MKTKLLFTNKKGIEVIACAESVGVLQLARSLAWELDKLGDERILSAANNTYGKTGHHFLSAVKIARDEIPF